MFVLTIEFWGCYLSVSYWFDLPVMFGPEEIIMLLLVRHLFVHFVLNISGVSATTSKNVVIIDARSYTAAVANRAKGGGCECAGL